MRRDLAVVLHGLWFRRWVSLAVLVVASLVVGAAVTGPLFLRAAGESVLRDTLAQAVTPGGRGVADAYSGPVSDDPVARVRSLDTGKLDDRPTLARLVGPPVAALGATVGVGARDDSADGALLAWREDACAHVRMTSGACPDQAGTVMVSASTADLKDWPVGTRLRLGPRPARVVGTYVPLDPAGDYWGGRPYFIAYAGPGGPAYAGPNASSLDVVLATQETVQDQGPDTTVVASVDRQLALDRIRVGDLSSLDAEASSWSVVDSGGLEGQTSLPAVLHQAEIAVDALRLPVAVVEAQLLVLCWLVLFLVVANAAEARGGEVALAKLRGVGTGATVAFGLLDTLLLVVLAVPVGFVLAWAWTTGLARWQLAPGVPVVLTSGTFLAAAGAGAGAAVAAVLATARTLRRPVVEQWRRATRRVASRSWFVDAAVAVVAAVGLVALLARQPAATSGTTTPGALALVAPSLVILVSALVGSRVLPGLCRAAYGSTRRRGQVAALLAVRQLGRRPGTLRLALLLTVAFGLVVFGVDAWSVARANAHDRAWTEVGAAQVLSVTVPPGTDLADVVDRVDPSGTQVAAVSTATDFTRLPSALLMGVQPDRFARVAFWRSDLGPEPLAALDGRLVTPSAPSVLLAGDRLRLAVDVPAMEAPAPPVLVADLVQPSAIGGTSPVVLGAVGPGRHTLEADLPCARKTCRLAGLELRRPGTSLVAYRGRVVLDDLQVRTATGWQDRRSAVTTVGGWRPSTSGARAAASGPDGTVLDVDSSPVDFPAWQVADHPAVLPAVVSAGVPDQTRTSSAGFGGQGLPLDPVVVTSALPAGGDRGILVDRGDALRASEGAVSRRAETVWLAPSAVTWAPPQLEAAGLVVLTTTSADDLARVYGRQGPSLALLLFLAGAGLAALLAGGGAALTLHLNGRRRTYELAAMVALGLRHRTLLASLWLEQGLLVLFGVVVGTASGLVAATLALPVIPEFSDAPTAPPLRYDLHPAPVLLSVAAATVVLVLTIAASSISLVRHADVDQLREAPA